MGVLDEAGGLDVDDETFAIVRRRGAALAVVVSTTERTVDPEVPAVKVIWFVVAPDGDRAVGDAPAVTAPGVEQDARDESRRSRQGAKPAP